MDYEDLTIKQAKEIIALFGEQKKSDKQEHPMIGKRCYSAGVYIGDVVCINPDDSMELKLDKAVRLWIWEGPGRIIL
jgi:hypothetical protein